MSLPLCIYVHKRGWRKWEWDNRTQYKINVNDKMFLIYAIFRLIFHLSWSHLDYDPTIQNNSIRHTIHNTHARSHTYLKITPLNNIPGWWNPFTHWDVKNKGRCKDRIELVPISFARCLGKIDINVCVICNLQRFQKEYTTHWLTLKIHFLFRTVKSQHTLCMSTSAL